MRKRWILPQLRTNEFSDSEATMSPGTISRISTETALRPGLHPTKPADSNLNPRLQANSVSKLTDTKFKTASSISSAPAGLIVVVCPLLLSLHAYVNRKEHVHAATSQPEPEDGLADEEPMAGRLRPDADLRSSRLSNAGTVTTSPDSITAKHRIREQKQYRDWTVHSGEITGISEDLAILAQEIDSVSSSGTAPSTTVSTGHNMPTYFENLHHQLKD
ncbi:hypothetical protein AMELA_G00048180 [Ameiurus melas]|uniref:CEP170 C-terminal domain-containing protein n=1 Tax=Ameiurus melas TaxID=219545 RepID=A0A7J6B7R5_AMEME|nr:hypothetical protein AMELA_G00048180 [Ameiurus melas]